MPFDLDRYHALNRATEVGARVRYLEATGSTMDDARAGADAGERCGTAYVAGEQAAGRGRQGRTWVSAAAAGLYVTYHLCPDEAQRAPLLAVAGALAASDAIAAAAALPTELKWPNDVLHQGRKLCGVLAESRRAAGTANRLDVFLGIGVNVLAAELPPDLAAIATSIEGAGAPPPELELLLAELSSSLEHWAQAAADQPAALIAEWRGRLVTLGRRVRLQGPARTVEGVAVDVAATGALLVRLDDGEVEAFAAGDVTAL